MNKDEWMNRFRTDKLGIYTDYAYISSIGGIHYNHNKIISELMPVPQLELPKDLFLYLDKTKEDE